MEADNVPKEKNIEDFKTKDDEGEKSEIVLLDMMQEYLEFNPSESDERDITVDKNAVATATSSKSIEVGKKKKSRQNPKNLVSWIKKKAGKKEYHNVYIRYIYGDDQRKFEDEEESTLESFQGYLTEKLSDDFSDQLKSKIKDIGRTHLLRFINSE